MKIQESFRPTSVKILSFNLSFLVSKSAPNKSSAVSFHRIISLAQGHIFVSSTWSHQREMERLAAAN